LVVLNELNARKIKTNRDKKVMVFFIYIFYLTSLKIVCMEIINKVKFYIISNYLYYLHNLIY
jgi:hypothetical protein